jgi:hypothetical protein
MRWKFSDHGHDSRQVDLLAVVVLLFLSIGAFAYVASWAFSTPPSTTAFIVPSQHVRW